VTRYHVDTSIHVERWGGGSRIRTEIEDRLGDRTDHSTSTHALREWLWVVGNAAADFLNAIKSRPTSWSDIFATLGVGYNRSQAQRFRVLSIIGQGDTSSALDLVAMETRADALIRYQARAMFEIGMGEIRDGSACALALNRVIQEADGRYALRNPKTPSQSPRCTQKDDVCSQIADLEAKLNRFQAAATALAASPDTGHQKNGKAGLRAVGDTRARIGQACWRNLGDLSIALECAQNEVLLTTDASFEVIGPALGLTVERLAATTGP
jgi:hypothetical protein